MFAKKTNRILASLVGAVVLMTFPVASSAQPVWGLRSTKGPSPRAGTSMVYDSCREVVVLYGGFNEAEKPPSMNHDTWEWDGSEWSLRSTDGPTAQHLVGMAFDSDRCVTVLFGGNDDQHIGYLRETWEWDGAAWTQRCQDCLPTQRHQPGMAYNSARQRVVIFGGWSGSSSLNDVWEWNGTTWAPVGTTACLTGEPTPTPRSGVGMAYDQTRDRIVVFGGRLVPVMCGTMSDETWELNMSVSPACWTLVSTLDAPNPREGMRMVYNPTDSTILLFGGSDTCSSAFADSWVYDGVTWEEANVGGPTARHLYAMAFDGLRDEFVLFGGFTTWNRGSADPKEYSGETWSYGTRAGIPTVSEWGLVVMALLVLTAGTVVLMRRRREAT